MIKICDYGCKQEAKYKFKNGKWCCSKGHTQCFGVRKTVSEALEGKSLSKEHKRKISESCRNPSKETRKKMSKSHKGKISPNKGKTLSKEHKRKISKACKLSIEKIEKKYPFFSQIEDMRYNPDKPGEKEIQVHCKYSGCKNSKESGGWFTPTSRQLAGRRDYLINENKDGLNFYCSKYCKDNCILYNLQSDPFKDIDKPYTYQENKIWKQKVLERDSYKCQYCDKKAEHVHHEKPVKTHPHLALDPDNGISCCEECHYIYGHRTGTECSTGFLANKNIPNCRLGD